MVENNTPTPPQPAVDFNTVFQALPACHVILTPDLMIVAATDAYFVITNTTSAQLIGHKLFDVFPETPDTVRDTAGKNLSFSLAEVLRTNQPHILPLQRYDLQAPGEPTAKAQHRWWRLTSSPIFNTDEEITYIINTVEDVTSMMSTLELAENTIRHSQ